MIFYHGTSEDNWKQIQEEGLLWGRRYVTDGNGNIIKEVSRCTYLAKEQSVAEEFGHQPWAKDTRAWLPGTS